MIRVTTCRTLSLQAIISDPDRVVLIIYNNGLICCLLNIYFNRLILKLVEHNYHKADNWYQS